MLVINYNDEDFFIPWSASQVPPPPAGPVYLPPPQWTALQPQVDSQWHWGALNPQISGRGSSHAPVLYSPLFSFFPWMSSSGCRLRVSMRILVMRCWSAHSSHPLLPPSPRPPPEGDPGASYSLSLFPGRRGREDVSAEVMLVTSPLLTPVSNLFPPAGCLILTHSTPSPHPASVTLVSSQTCPAA